MGRLSPRNRRWGGSLPGRFRNGFYGGSLPPAMRGSNLLLGVAMSALVVGLCLASLGGISAAPVGASPTRASAPSYNVTFTETGLPSGTNWSVHVAFIGCGCSGVRETVSSETPSIVIPLPNGSYRYHIERLPAFVAVGPARGTVTVAGAAPAPISVTFVPVVTYPVEFSETGLPSGTSWTVHINGNGIGQVRALEDLSNSSTSTTIGFTLPNATYHYTVGPVNGSFFLGPSHGAFTVAGASPPPIGVQFTTPAKYTLSFVETGLIPGMSWSVAIHGGTGIVLHETGTSTGAPIVFYLPNGTYHYQIAAVIGYLLSGSASGTVNVAAAPATVGAAFHEVGSDALYLVDFNETGLASGTDWSVHVGVIHSFGRGSHATSASTGTTVSFALQNGTYRYHILPVRGYTEKPGAGTFAVAGAAVPAIPVAFTAIPTYLVTFNATGLPNGTNWSLLVHTQAGAGSLVPIRETRTSNSTSLTFAVTNGTFCYRFLSVRGWHVTTGVVAGSFVVAGASPATVYVVYTAR
jgi:hypothetical protein